MASSVSPAGASSTAAAAQVRQSPCSAGPPEFQIAQGPTGPPAGTISSPVDRIATRGRRTTSTFAYPAAAASEIRQGSSRTPLASSRWPAWKSPPRGRMWPDASASGPRRTISSPSRVAVSWITTQSAPSGTGAPVKMRTASPGPRSRSNPRPAALSPMILSRVSALRASPRRTAQPSIAEARNGGWSRRASTSCASARPSASSSATVSISSGRTCASIRTSASFGDGRRLTAPRGRNRPTCRPASRAGEFLRSSWTYQRL